MVLNVNPQPQTTTDAAGVFQLAGLIAGSVIVCGQIGNCGFAGVASKRSVT